MLDVILRSDGTNSTTLCQAPIAYMALDGKTAGRAVPLIADRIEVTAIGHYLKAWSATRQPPGNATLRCLGGL